MGDTLQSDSFMTPSGRQYGMFVRPDTSDWNTVNSCAGTNDEYHLPAGLEGWAVDVGAHIGAATVPLLIDNPQLRVIAIEALPENVELLRLNLARNGVDDRCIVLQGAAGDGSPARVGYNDADPHHRFIGGMNAPAGNTEVVADGVALADVMLMVRAGGGERVAWLKIDCEGCEYPFLESDQLGWVDHIEGEVHFGSARLTELLAATHQVSYPRFAENPDFGPFTADVRARSVAS